MMVQGKEQAGYGVGQVICAHLFVMYLTALARG